jgi:hypothetical protein
MDEIDHRAVMKVIHCDWHEGAIYYEDGSYELIEDFHEAE